jgi:hypothetical protein
MITASNVTPAMTSATLRPTARSKINNTLRISMISYRISARSIPILASTHTATQLTQDKEDNPDDQDDDPDRPENADAQDPTQDQQNHTEHNHGAPPFASRITLQWPAHTAVR